MSHVKVAVWERVLAEVHGRDGVLAVEDYENLGVLH